MAPRRLGVAPCNLGTSTPKPNSTVVTNDSLIIRGFRDHGLPGLLDVEDIGGGFNRGLYFRDGINNTHLNPNWQQLLGGMLDSALPFIEEGAIKGVRNSCDKFVWSGPVALNAEAVVGTDFFGR